MSTIFIEANNPYYRQIIAQAASRFELTTNRNQARVVISVFERSQGGQTDYAVSVRDIQAKEPLSAYPFDTTAELQTLVEAHISSRKMMLTLKPAWNNSPLQRGIETLRSFFQRDTAQHTT